jgi:hypothetical protein
MIAGEVEKQTRLSRRCKAGGESTDDQNKDDCLHKRQVIGWDRGRLARNERAARTIFSTPSVSATTEQHFNSGVANATLKNLNLTQPGFEKPG